MVRVACASGAKILGYLIGWGLFIALPKAAKCTGPGGTFAVRMLLERRAKIAC